MFFSCTRGDDRIIFLIGFLIDLPFCICMLAVMSREACYPANPTPFTRAYVIEENYFAAHPQPSNPIIYHTTKKGLANYRSQIVEA